MRELWDHVCAGTEDLAEHGAVCGSVVVVATRPPGSFTETVTTLAALDVTDGSVRWLRECLPLALNQAIDGDGELVVVLHQGDRPVVRGYDADDGTERWSHPLTGEPRGVLLRGPRVVVVSGSTVRTLDREGRLVRKASVAGAELTTLAATTDGDLVTTNGRGKKNVLRLDGDTLEIQWTARIPGESCTYRDPPVITADSVHVHNAASSAMSFDVATGEVRWRKRKPGFRSGVVLAGPDDTVLWGTDSLAAVRASDGKVGWRLPLVVAAAATSDPGRVVVARRSDAPFLHTTDEPLEVALHVVDARTGRAGPGLPIAGVTRHWVAGDMSGRLFTVANGVVVSGLQAGHVRSYALET